MFRRCWDCKKEKPLEEFGKDRNRALGRKYQCKACRRAENQRNAERNRAYMREYYQRTKEDQSERRRAWRENNKEKIQEYYRSYREQHQAAIKQIQRSYRQDNWDLIYAHNRRCRARKLAAEGCHTSEEVLQMFNDQNGLCAYCETPIADSYHVDHMIPLSRGGRNDWSNLAITCESCNLRKNNKTAEEFLEKVKGHSKTAGPHKTGNDRADELAVAAKKKVGGAQIAVGHLSPE